MKRFMMLVLGSVLGIALSVPAWAQNTTPSTNQKQSTTTPAKKETKEEKKARKEAERAKKKADKNKGTTNTTNKNNPPTK